MFGDTGVAVWLPGPATWPWGATTAPSLLFHMLSLGSTGIVTLLKLARLVVQCLAQVLKRGERFLYVPRGKKKTTAGNIKKDHYGFTQNHELSLACHLEVQL